VPKTFREFVSACPECGAEPGCNIDCPTCAGLSEDEGAGAPANSAGLGNIAGLGVNKAGKPANWGEPGVNLKKRHVDEAPESDPVLAHAFQHGEPQVDGSTRELAVFHPEPDYSSETDDELDVWLRTHGMPKSSDWTKASQAKTIDVDEASEVKHPAYKCPACGKSNYFKSAEGYRPFCSSECAGKSTHPKMEGQSDFDYSNDIIEALLAEGVGVVPAETFAGAAVFEVDMDAMHKSRFGKNRYHRYSRYVGEDEVGEAIRKHGRDRKNGDIILKDSKTAVMTYLRRKPVM
jgi:hypothetical protein